jgi:hypothetical protein
MSQERGNWEWIGATMINMQAEIDRLRARVATLEGKAVPRTGPIPADHEFDEHGKCKWCPAERTT